jgi:hypothetical protein
MNDMIWLETSGIDILTSVGIEIWSELGDRFGFGNENSFAIFRENEFPKIAAGWTFLISWITLSLTAPVGPNIFLTQYGSFIKNIASIMWCCIVTLYTFLKKFYIIVFNLFLLCLLSYKKMDSKRIWDLESQKFKSRPDRTNNKIDS